MRGSSTLAPASSGVEGTTSRPLHAAGPRGVAQREVARQAVVDVRAGVLGKPKCNRGVALRVEVDEQGRVAGVGDRRAEVDRGGGLAHPALLVGDCENGAHRGSSYGSGRSEPASAPRFAPERRNPATVLDCRTPSLQSRTVHGSGRLAAIPGRRGKRSGVGAILRKHEQVAIARARERLDRQHLLERHPHLGRRPLPQLQFVRAPQPPSKPQARPKNAQQRRRVLHQHRQAQPPPAR